MIFQKSWFFTVKPEVSEVEITISDTSSLSWFIFDSYVAITGGNGCARGSTFRVTMDSQPSNMLRGGAPFGREGS